MTAAFRLASVNFELAENVKCTDEYNLNEVVDLDILVLGGLHEIRVEKNCLCCD